MAELPHMPMFWSDYFGDTRHLTCVEHGAYLQLLGQYWLTGHGLPDDNARLARLVGMSKKDWLAVRDTVAEFFAITGGVWLHNRVERELQGARGKVDQARNAANARWSNKPKGSKGKARAMRTHSDSTSGGNADACSDAMPSKTRTNINPLTPLRGADADAPGPSGGRASAGTEAKPIGQILTAVR